MESFPDRSTVAELRRLRVRTVVVLHPDATGSPYQAALDAPITGLGLARRDLGYAVVEREYEPWQDPRLIVDTSRPVTECLTQIAEYLTD